MSRISEKFNQLKKDGKKGLIAYITAGDPNLKMSLEFVKAFEKCGVQLIELGIPFSDPLADGVVNQMAAARSLSAGTTVRKIIHLVERIRKVSEIPIILFTYLNPILKYGLRAFARDAQNAGADGILALDLPPEESMEYKEEMDRFGLDTIFLVAPTSSDERISQIAHQSSGFIYCVSRTGVTGPKSDIPSDVPQLIRRIKNHSTLPVAVGFGISNPKQVVQLSKLADAVVVGSAIVKRIGDHARNPQLLKMISKFVSELTGVL